MRLSCIVLVAFFFCLSPAFAADDLPTVAIIPVTGGPREMLSRANMLIRAKIGVEGQFRPIVQTPAATPPDALPAVTSDYAITGNFSNAKEGGFNLQLWLWSVGAGGLVDTRTMHIAVVDDINEYITGALDQMFEWIGMETSSPPPLAVVAPVVVAPAGTPVVEAPAGAVVAGGAAPNETATEKAAPVATPSGNKANAPQIGAGTESYSFGLGGEANLLRDSKRIGVGIAGTAEYRINRRIGAGVRVAASHDFKETMAEELGFFARLYFLSPPLQRLNPFVEMGIGAAMMEQIKEGEDLKWETQVMVGLGLGVRIEINQFYLEPYIRGGVPFLVGTGLIFGYSMK